MRSMRHLFILRGVPGTGKTTLAQILTTNGNSRVPYCNYAMCSADDFFYDEQGNYNFDPSKLGDAHKQCQERCKDAMEKEKDRIVVHNTNIELWEMEPYLKMAEAYGYTPMILCSEMNYGSVHGVPDSIIEDMRDRYQPSNQRRSEKDLEMDRSRFCDDFLPR